MRGVMSPVLTEVELIFIEKHTEHWLRFGCQSRERILDRRRRVVAFVPGELFALVRWEGNEYGTVSSRLDIVRTCAAHEPISTIPGITPGGDVLLRLEGWLRVKRAFDAIAAIEALGIDPADVAPDWWRHLHNRIVCRAPFRVYGPAQHRAWLLRRQASR